MRYAHADRMSNFANKDLMSMYSNFEREQKGKYFMLSSAQQNIF